MPVVVALVVVVLMVVGTVAGMEVDGRVKVDVGVDILVVVEIDVDVLQDAKTSDITMRQVRAIQIIPLFI